MHITIPNYGAPPLAKTFLLARILQITSLSAIITITGLFTSDIVKHNGAPAVEIIATLAVTSTATFYAILSLVFFWSHANLGLLVMCGLDFLLSIAFVIVAVTLGKPVSYLDCFGIPKTESTGEAVGFVNSVVRNLNKEGNLVGWLGATRTKCLEVKGVWGLSIALCILFLCSVLVLPALFAKHKRSSKTTTKTDA